VQHAGHPGRMTSVLLRLVYLGVTITFARFVFDR
jgi:hypothetical protein